MSSSGPLKIAMIGFGPRGLGALESLASLLLDRRADVSVDIYDPTPWTGSGPNYSPDQSDLCILNIPARIVDYQPPAFMAAHIGTFLDWADGRYQPDDFPPRADIGAYLHDRFNALKTAVGETITLSQSTQLITAVDQDADGWWVTSKQSRHGPYDEVLLSQGQPKAAPDPQLAKWNDHAADHNLPLFPAYPANTLIEAAPAWAAKTVAIRGMGLSTLDVLRMLTQGQGGKFSNGVYHPSGREPRKLLPFSLDGRPPVAKPATAALDARFAVTTAEAETFTSAMTAVEQCDGDDALHIICDALIGPIRRILTQQGGRETGDDLRVWLDMERSRPGSQNQRTPIDSLRVDIEMAHGRLAPDIGYVAGQVWRKLQDQLRSTFNQGRHCEAAATAIIGFDEALKRYSYGPPVFAAEDLLALIEQGIVSLCVVDDPSVILNATGWQLLDNDDAVMAQVMVDAVLPSPTIENVEDTLIAARRSAGDIQEKYDGMGACITPDGQMIGASGSVVAGLCMLGRLTLGSVIAADGLDDCFGPSTTRWAKGVMNRHTI